MQPINDVVRGLLVATVPERLCFNSMADLLRALPDLLSVEVPSSTGSLVVSSSDPGEDQRGKLWLRTTNSGGIIGLYVFQGGKWNPFYQFAPGQVMWLYGDSANIPEGLLLIEAGDDVVPAPVVAHLVPQYLPNGGGGYSYFAVRYIGF